MDKISSSLSGIALADDGKPYISHVQSLYDGKGNVWRVEYRCGNLRAFISQLSGFCVLAYSVVPGNIQEKRYTTWERAWRGLHSLRRKYA